MGEERGETGGGGLGLFGRYLTIWVALCMVGGVLIGRFAPAVPEALSRVEVASVSIPVAVLVWLMIFPMLAQIDFASVLRAGRQPKGLVITLTVNWLVKPFSMFAFGWLFLLVLFAPLIEGSLGREYLAGLVLLGAAPCTAMVFVWSYLTRGDPGYTLVQVAVNNVVMVFAFAPIVLLLLGLGDIVVPWETVLLSVVLYIVVPLAAALVARRVLTRRRGAVWFETRFVPSAGRLTPIGLLLTLVLLFAFQGDVILSNPLHIGLIAVPLVVQTFFVFALAYGWARVWRVRHDVAAPAALIGTSNFFELAVATAIVLFGMQSGAALATVVGVLVEVPLMLVLVGIVNRTRRFFPTAEVPGMAGAGEAGGAVTADPDA